MQKFSILSFGLRTLSIFIAATVSITPLPRIVSRHDIVCPGDIIPFNCSIQSKTVHLIWRVTLPGQMAIDILYNDTSNINVTRLNGYVTTSLTRYIGEEYIESVLTITVQPNESIDQLRLQCLIEDLGNDSSYVFFNTSSKLWYY